MWMRLEEIQEGGSERKVWGEECFTTTVLSILHVFIFFLGKLKRENLRI